METKYSRRSVLAGSALALLDATLTRTAQAQTRTQTQTPGSGKAKDRASDPKVIKTRKAACMCGQLAVTYTGPDPERRSMCQCNNCLLRTGSVFSVQARMQRANSKIEGKSPAWTFHNDKATSVTFPTCDSSGATYHFSAMSAVLPSTGTLPSHRTSLGSQLAP